MKLLLFVIPAKAGIQELAIELGLIANCIFNDSTNQLWIPAQEAGMTKILTNFLYRPIWNFIYHLIGNT
jgi:hypothetical protein